ncbi:hypothetical protein IPZ78_13725 [Sphingobacterium sp. WQ 366]|uniref:DUF4157 domain-containing protein n=1 Tax=Sphingobacterium bovistauri TaxID=2781959 RepID=A0ABS7ZBW2_9SPHI|nr:hypothetical protein [Sphingobacterium bovistauri]
MVSRFWTKVFSFGKAEAITIFPFIFLRRRGLKTDQVLLNHERIHLLQALELLILPFYIWYLVEFTIRFIQFRDFHKAYRNISFEREAYANESNFNYLKSKKLWSFCKYL